MKNSRVLFLFAAMGLLAGCAKEIANTTEISSLEVTIAQDLTAVKTQMGPSDGSARKLYWSDGDDIRVNGIPSAPLEGVAEGTASASFTFNQPLASAPFNLLYPASIWTDATHVTLPATQTYAAGGFADKMYPMAGYSADGSNLAFHHLCAVVKVNVIRAPEVEADVHNITSVSFMGGNNEQVSGPFTINYSTPSLSGSSEEEADKKVTVSHSQSIAGHVATYYIVVPARTYSNGFSFRIQDASGDAMTASVSGSQALSAGKLYNMSDIAFVPTESGSGDVDLTIGSAQDLIDFATGYNNKTLATGVKVKVTADIVFDESSSAAFNATKGIGLKKNDFGDEEDYYFGGTFDGNGHTIKNLAGTVPLFKATSSGSTIKDLTIDNTCSFAFTHNNVGEADLGPVVGYLKGIMKNVNVAANVSLAPKVDGQTITQVTALGGLVGRVTEGDIIDCTYSGNITLPLDFSVNAKNTHVGGLVGEITNANGLIKDSNFDGTLESEARVASTDKNNPYFFLGGIVGSNLLGTVDGCATSDHPKAVTMPNSKSYEGTILNHSTLLYHMAQGGIAGQNTGVINNCNNGATIQNFVLTTGTSGTAADANSRYYDLGGVVGLNNPGGSVSNCENLAAIESRSTPRIQKIGGVIGYNKGQVSGCTNSSGGTIYLTTTNSSPYSVRVGEIGGVIGNNASSDVKDVHNAGNISVDRTENNVGVELKFGGVMGITTADIDGEDEKSITNEGNITDTYNGATVTTAGLRFGGIVGSAQASVRNAVNRGNITFTLSNANVMSKLYMGGIAGELSNSSDAEIGGCENSGEVYFNLNSQAAAHTGNYIGGIVGFVTGEDHSASIFDCVNGGYVHIAGSSTTALTDLCVGGIVARMAENGSISGCDNTEDGEVDISFSNAAHTDNYSGGIVGKSAGYDVSLYLCNNAGYIHGGNGSKQNGKTMYVGGIIAYLDGNSSIAGCSNTGGLRNNQFNNTNTKVGSTFEGGIAGFVAGTAEKRISISDVDNAVSDEFGSGSRRGYCGGIVGYAEYTDISDASSTVNYSGSSSYWIGGIAGWLVNSTVTNGNYFGTSIQSSQIQGGGGIVCTLDAGSVLDGCSSYLETITHASGITCVDGAVAAKSVAGSTIKNCHYVNKYSICSDKNFTDGGGNVADL